MNLRHVALTAALLVLALAGCGSSGADAPSPSATQPALKGLVFAYGVGAKSVLDTARGTFTKDMIAASPVTVTMKLSAGELTRITRMMDRIDFFSYPRSYTTRGQGGWMEPHPSYRFVVTTADGTKVVEWEDAVFNGDRRAAGLRKLARLIEAIITARPEYKRLPSRRAATCRYGLIGPRGRPRAGEGMLTGMHRPIQPAAGGGESTEGDSTSRPRHDVRPRFARPAILLAVVVVLTACFVMTGPQAPAGSLTSAGAAQTEGIGAAAMPPERWVAVSVATLWVEPGVARPVDAPACANPADPAGWVAAMTTAQKRWLVGRLETQALYGTRVYLLDTSGEWAKIAVPSQATPRNPWGYPGWVPTRQLNDVAPEPGLRTGHRQEPDGVAVEDARVERARAPALL